MTIDPSHSNTDSNNQSNTLAGQAPDTRSLRELIQSSYPGNQSKSTDDGSGLSRRGFVAGLSAGSLVLMASLSSESGAEIQAANLDGNASESSAPESFAPDLFLSIDDDGTVNILAHRSEMGTGIRTGLPRVLADELEADWSRVKIHQAKGDKRLGDQNTDGSNSIRFFFETMRTAGATARLMLERAAAKRWGVAAEKCVGSSHHVKLKGTKKQIAYGDLVAEAKKQKVPKPGELTLKPRSQWKYIGKDAPIVDLDDIVTGKAKFGIDARMENQLFAVIARPPVVGGAVESVDATEARKIPGVVDVLQIPGFKGAPKFQPLGGVAVCATSTWAALQGRDALKIKWNLGPNADYDTVEFARELKKTVNQPCRVVREKGDAQTELKDANKVLKADYSVPHLAHAPMEPTCAVANVKTDNNGKVTKCHILAATQNPQAVQQAVAPAMEIKEEEVVCDVTLLGAGFGRKSKPDYCVEAAVLSRKLKRPVHVTWTREDDLQHDYYHAIAAIHCEASLDKSGKTTSWLQRVAYPTITSTFVAGAKTPAAWEAEMGHTDLPFDIPHLRLESGDAVSKVRTGWLRSVCHIQQNFAVGSFADELAIAAGKDSLDFLLDLLGKDRVINMKNLKLGNRGASEKDYPYDIGRLKNVLRRAAINSSWSDRKKLPKGQGMGIACCRSFLGYTGHVVQVAVSKKGEVTIEKVWCSLDSGTIVSPDRVRSQVEGAAIMGTSQVRYGEVAFKKGRSTAFNFGEFKVARMGDSPKEIHVDVVESTAAPAGVGETGVPSFAPAFCNAIFDAIGVRVRDLPLKNHDLSWS